MKDHRILTRRQEKAAEDELFTALMGLRTVAEYRAFFQDLCTPAELQAMKDRWGVVE
ncbi:MAG: Trp family transcriptional regulator, partial [Gammaproteobacteria bacterium]